MQRTILNKTSYTYSFSLYETNTETIPLTRYHTESNRIEYSPTEAPAC